VTNPNDPTWTWDIKNSVPFQSNGGALNIDIGWDSSFDFTNKGSNAGTLAPLTALGDAAAFPVRIGGLTSKTGPTAGNATACTFADCGTTELNRFFAVATVTPLPFGAAVTTGRVVLEGKPVCNGSVFSVTCPDPTYSTAVPPVATYANIPVTSAAQNFTFAPTGPLAAVIDDPRRPIVDINKCKTCHDDTNHGTGIVPRLSLHGANRNENLAVCVVCHNPNQTDVPYRLSGPEVPIDFKTMVHSIHAGGFRETPFVVIGFRSSVNDFSAVRFPRELRDCTNCHVQGASGKWTFELPLRAGVLGTTVKTQSSYLTAPRSIDVDPANDLKISPTAAVCSSCHDKREVRSHMIRTGGASFSTIQQAIGVTVNERCASCHGPGKEKDVRGAHEIRTGSGSSGGGDRHRERGDD
jgi:OmcA/MtrC family decaheme c-type cytochrome